VDNVWAPIVGVITSDTLRDVYIGDITQTGTNASSNVVGSALNDLSIGRQFGNTAEFPGLIAEVAIWNTDLSTAQITSYMTGTAASGIAASNLIGYWPLNTDGVLTNSGTDAGGDLTASGAVFDADHPTISSGSTPLAVFTSQFRYRRA
jgi:hypothetical protein